MLWVNQSSQYGHLLERIEKRHRALFSRITDYSSIAPQVENLRQYIAGVYDAASLFPEPERDAVQGFCRNKESVWIKVHFLGTGEYTAMLA